MNAKSEINMHPKPVFFNQFHISGSKLKRKVAIITGGDSGIGRAVAVLFAQEGAQIVIIYLKDKKDAIETQKIIEDIGEQCFLIKGDVGNPNFCHKAVKKVIQTFGSIDILVNNAGEITVKKTFKAITEKQLVHTFQTNIFGMFFMTQAVYPYLKSGSCIINTASISAYQGDPEGIDYAATKGAVVSFTRSLSQNLIKQEIRVNAVAPGAIWTPMIAGNFSKKEIKEFVEDIPMKRMGQPIEIAPSYLFLASDDASYMTGQVLHPNGGYIINA